ncbi:twin-arginine translocase TatA/TatE family subunit [Saccharospirillum mangrovi]|uniref:twin-arginine translocase TatA/TatE family subunit n=1 Tax=Saccharospirillum mangrovi TaxID=2161747 RepID=UPI000D34DAD6|nr:twin-arginine translocase TatA/TatE family subunit [Saccharospirillum mangrovi]
MGFGGISIWQLLIVLAIVVLIFGTKRLKGLGGDVGGAIKSFKSAMNEDDKTDDTKGLEEKSKDAQFSETASAEAKQDSDKSAH